MKTKLDKNDIKVYRMQKEATVFRFAKRLKVPFINITYEYEEPTNPMSVGSLYVVFELNKWAGKIVNHGVKGLKCIEYWSITKNNTIEVAMLHC